MDFGGMLSNLAINAGHSQIAGANYQQQLAQTEDTRALAQQRQMTALAMKQEMEERKLGLDDAKAGFATVSGGIKTQADIVKGATAAAAIAAGKGHFGVAAEMEKLASGAEDNVRKQSLDAATALQAKKEDMALSANNFLANPTPEGAREVEQKAIAAGVDPRTIPQRSDPAYTPWVKQQVQAPMTSKERLEFRQKVDKANEDRAEKQREFDTAEKRRVAEEARLALDRENARLLRLATLHVIEERLQLQKDRAPAGGEKLTAQERNTVAGVISAVGESVRGLKLIGAMPASSVSGAFAGLHGNGVLDALTKVGGNVLTPESNQMYQVATQGLGMEIGRALTLGGGRGVTQAQIDEFQSMVQARPGDTEATAMYKYANAASILRNRLETLPDSPIEKTRKEQQKYMEELQKVPEPSEILAMTKSPAARQQMLKSQVDMNRAIMTLGPGGASPVPATLPAGWK